MSSVVMEVGLPWSPLYPSTPHSPRHQKMVTDYFLETQTQRGYREPISTWEDALIILGSPQDRRDQLQNSKTTRLP